MSLRPFAMRSAISLFIVLFVCLPYLVRPARAGAQSAGGASGDTLAICHIPFTFDALLQPRILIRVSINGKAPLPFWVDTGLNTGLLIDTRAAGELGLSPDIHSPETAVGSIKTRSISPISLSLPDASPTGTVLAERIKTALVGDLTLLQPTSSHERFAGIIGIAAFLDSAVQIDFVAHIMTLYPHPKAVMHLNGASVLPMYRRANDKRYFVRVTLEKDIETELLVDTGAEGTGIPMSVAHRLHPIASRSSGTASLYGLSIMPTLLLRSVHLGACALKQVAVNTMMETSAGFPLGIDLLSRFRVVLDFPDRLLLLKYPAEGKTGSTGRSGKTDGGRYARLDGYTGIHLAIQKENSQKENSQKENYQENYVVEMIDEGAPAQKAGLHIGDILVSIDRHKLDGLSFLTARRLLNGFADTCAQLTLRRANGQNYTASFIRRSEFSRPRLPVDGLFLSKPAHKPVEVVGALSDCSGKQAGLQQGDIILDFNGYPTQEITPDILAVEFRKPQLTLKVQRKGVSEPLSYTLTAQ